MRKNYIVTILVAGLLMSLGGVASAAISVDGTNYVTAVNPLGRMMSEEVGGYTVLQANSDSGMIAWDFEPSEFTVGQQLDSIICHSSLPTPINKRIWFDAILPWGRLINVDAGKASSGDTSLAYSASNSTEAVIRLVSYVTDTPIFGVGMVLSRLPADMPVVVYDGSDNALYSGTIQSNIGLASEFSWFGYRGNTAIAKIVFDTSAAGFGSIFWMDDVAVTTSVPEPMTIALLGLGSLAVLRRKK